MFLNNKFHIYLNYQLDNLLYNCVFLADCYSILFSRLFYETLMIICPTNCIMALNALLEITFIIHCTNDTDCNWNFIFSGRGGGGQAPKLRKVTFQSPYTCVKIFKSYKLKHNDGCTAICFGVGATRHDLAKNHHVIVLDQ